ncbi:amino acid permease [Cetobacterium sp. SF1]|uniref:amino acid permease n=1 Tax=Cetobacterium sp. SF1 TaxID=3417654 RepID=UPI003CF356FD
MEKKFLSVSSLVMIIFIGVFGFGNVANNFKEVGLSSTTMILIGSLLYFLPLCLIMAEFGSYAKDRTGGIYSWIEIGLGKNMAYFAIWSYFIANIFYLPTLATRVPTYLSFAIYGDANISNTQTALLAAVALIFSLIVGVKFEKKLNSLSSPIGFLSIFTVIIFLLAGVYLYLTGNSSSEITLKSFNIDFSTTSALSNAIGKFSWILFAFGGAEIVGPYVNKVENPEKNFLKGLLFSSGLIALLYILSIISIATFGTQEEFSKISLVNAVIVGYKFMGYKLGIGLWFVKFIGLAYSLITLIALTLWSASLAAVVFSEAPEGTFPTWMTKKDKNGILKNALIFQTVLSFLFIMLTTYGGSKAGELYYKIYDMSTMAFLVPYFCLGASYISFRLKNIKSPFQISKNKYIASLAGILVTIMTLFAFIFAGYNFTIPLNQQFDTLQLYYGGLGCFLFLGFIIKIIKFKNK